MKKLFLCVFCLALLFYFACWRLPKSTPVTLPQLPTHSTTLLLPLDSRPVCTSLPTELGKLSGTRVILPPIGFLDNYQKPADRQKLYLWLSDNLPAADNAIISADLLIHGGLINSRLPYGSESDGQNFIAALSQLNKSYPDKSISSFAIVPRLLVSDHLLPDRWYQWHLMRYATLRDMTETFGDPYLTAEQEKLAAKIPPEILQKYLNLYKNNDSFNRNFVQLADAGIATVIGQDDGSSFGLPNRNLTHAQMYGAHTQNSYTTYGADELAAVLIAREFLRQENAAPKIYLHYADPSMEFMYMPFMAASVGQTLRDKARLLGVQLVEQPADADIIVYVNCGSDKFKPGKSQAQELAQLIGSGKHIALIDLSANFSEDELLMPQLLHCDVPVNRLASYAGWNTFSNSAGTTLAQAVIFQVRASKLSGDELAALHTDNLQFIITRLLDDYVYQKLYHSQLRSILTQHDYDADNLSAAGQNMARLLTQQFINRKAAELLHYNLGRTPFYTADGKAYYLRSIDADVYLPWNRVFEVGMEVKTGVGVEDRK